MLNTHSVNRVDMMEQMVDDGSVVFRYFTRLFRFNKDKKLFFLEGDDDIDYYQHVFDRYIGDYRQTWVELVCNGRQNVIDLVKDLRQHSKVEYRQCAYFGFVDKDYHEVHDNPYPTNIYVTPVYSIENFYISKEFMEKILDRKFFLKENAEKNTDFERCLDNYLSRRNEFLDGIKELDILLRCNRIMFEEAKIKSKINARDINLAQIVSISLDEVVFNSSALDVLGKKLSDFDEQCLIKSREFYIDKSYDDLALLVRGKFMFFFIHNYLHRLKEDTTKKDPVLFCDSYYNSKLVGSEKIKFKKTNITLTKERQDILSDFSLFSDKPDCLITCLKAISGDVET